MAVNTTKILIKLLNFSQNLHLFCYFNTHIIHDIIKQQKKPEQSNKLLHKVLINYINIYSP